MNDIEQNAEKIPERALIFLRAIGLSPELRARMNAAGYSEEAHREGWDLIAKTSGFYGGAPDAYTKRAINKLVHWRANGCQRLRKILVLRYPDQEAFVFEGIDASTEPVSAVATILDRLDALEGVGPLAGERAVHAAIDTRAIAMLEACNIGRDQRRELRTQVSDATPLQVSAEESAAHDRALEALRIWYDDWSTVARLIFERPGELVRLGLADRKARRPKRPDAHAHAQNTRCAACEASTCTTYSSESTCDATGGSTAAPPSSPVEETDNRSPKIASFDVSSRSATLDQPLM